MFEAFPKIARLQRDCVITEKLDGTNAQVVIERVPAEATEHGFMLTVDTADNRVLAGDIAAGELFYVYAGSRTRLIKPGKTTDNFGFAAWVWEHSDELVKLGPGRHFGEWYGQGIQRNYGLTEKRFALFPSSRVPSFPDEGVVPACCHVVPTLYVGPFDSDMIAAQMTVLREGGSYAVPGFMNPEGIIVFHTAARVLFKQTFDDAHKEAA